jgi:hypothetical protein
MPSPCGLVALKSLEHPAGKFRFVAAAHLVWTFLISETKNPAKAGHISAGRKVRRSYVICVLPTDGIKAPSVWRSRHGYVCDFFGAFGVAAACGIIDMGCRT